MSRLKPALLSCALLLSLMASAAQSARAQAVAPAPKPAGIHARVTEIEVNSSVPDDPAVEKMLQAYARKVRALNEVIGKLKGDLKKGGIGAGSMGNLVADALRDRAQVKLGKPVLLAIVNSGGLRKNAIAEGELTAGDIFELLPFENALVTVDLTGEQLRRFLDVVMKHRDAQSGARITFRTNDKKENIIESVKLGNAANEFEIDPKVNYTIATIDYLVKRGGDYSILQEGKNLQQINVTMRDAVLDYVKSETSAGRPIKATLDGRFRSDKPQTDTEQPQ
ncbi:MAG: 5'-nucleotidase C-terminal domain-containing protein [Acidobacteriota bacterium]